MSDVSLATAWYTGITGRFAVSCHTKILHGSVIDKLLYYNGVFKLSTVLLYVSGPAVGACATFTALVCHLVNIRDQLSCRDNYTCCQCFTVLMQKLIIIPTQHSPESNEFLAQYVVDRLLDNNYILNSVAYFIRLEISRLRMRNDCGFHYRASQHVRSTYSVTQLDLLYLMLLCTQYTNCSTYLITVQCKAIFSTRCNGPVAIC